MANLSIPPFRILLRLLFLVVPSLLVTAWVLPGSFPVNHSKGDEVKIKVNKLTSIRTQLPYEYYHLKFPRPETIFEQRENLGEVLMGDKVQNSLYEIRLLEDMNCKQLGNPVQLTPEDRLTFISMIDDQYLVHMSCDNLPLSSPSNYDSVAVASSGNDRDTINTKKLPGYPLGTTDVDNKHYLHNHLSIKLLYHVRESLQYRIVGFEATPLSIQHTRKVVDGQIVYECPHDPSGNPPTRLILENAVQAVFSYDVEWSQSNLKWVSRWDSFLTPQNTDIHWFSIINSFMTVLFLSGMLALILLRTLLRDIARYNSIDDAEEAREESGWKLVHGDVFRTPLHSQLLSSLAGTGIQILGMTIITIVIATLGLISPTNRGALLQAMLFFFTFWGYPAGYISARFNKLFKGEDIRRNFKVTIMTAFLYPGVCFCVFFLLNLFLTGKESSGAVPFGTMLLLLVLWFGISVPLVFCGSYVGYRKKIISLPVRTNQIPRQIPPQHWMNKSFWTYIVGGVLPFGAVFTELHYILSSIWLHHFYYLFGFVFIVLLLLIATCAEISIAFVYFQLAAEDYHWWWRAYFSSASSGVYVLLYAIVYFVTGLDITSPLSVTIYFGYMLLMSWGFFLLTGAIGFICTFVFVRAIYGSIKVD